jgi:hypothetical protein
MSRGVFGTGDFGGENGDVQRRHECNLRGDSSFGYRFTLVSIMGTKSPGCLIVVLMWVADCGL